MLRNITWGTYIFFAAWLLLGFLFVYFFVPETRGKTLEEMDAAFGSHTSEADLALLKEVQDEVGLTALLQGHVEGIDSDEEAAVTQEKRASQTEKVAVV